MTIQYKVESGVQIPEHRRKYEYPFEDMAVGDSFEVKPEDGEHMFSMVTRVRGAAGSANHWMKPKKFTVRSLGESVRVWRTA